MSIFPHFAIILHLNLMAREAPSSGNTHGVTHKTINPPLPTDDPPPCFTIDRSRPEWLGAPTVVETPPHEQSDTHLPQAFELYQNHPNPFNPETAIRFAVKEKCRVVLKIYDILGRQVMTLVDGDYAPGYHQAVFTARALPSGTYFYRIKMKNFHDVKKMVVLE